MKQAIVLFIVAFCAASSWATTSRFQDGDSIKINKNFMRELEAAFLFDQPKADDYKLIAPQPLTKEKRSIWLHRLRKLACNVRGDMDVLFPKEGPAGIHPSSSTR